MTIDKTLEEVWYTFWKDIVAPNGVLDLEQVKRELYDFWVVMQQVPKVYDHVTGGKVSKIMTDPDAVIALADDAVNDLINDCVEDERKCHEST